MGLTTCVCLRLQLTDHTIIDMGGVCKTQIGFKVNLILLRVEIDLGHNLTFLCPKVISNEI